MSFQMSRVRGASLYRLVVTRTTNIDSICGWLGLDRAQLIAANPNLVTDELEAGEELVVLASYVQLHFPHSDGEEIEPARSHRHEDDDGSTATQEAYQEESQGEAEQDASSRAEARVDSLPESAEILQASEGPEPSRDTEEIVVVVRSSVAQEEAEATEEQEKQSAEQTESPAEAKMTWKPFPKSDLLS